MAGSSDDAGNDTGQPITKSLASDGASGLSASTVSENAGRPNKKVHSLITMIAATLALGVAATIVWSFVAPSDSDVRKLFNTDSSYPNGAKVVQVQSAVPPISTEVASKEFGKGVRTVEAIYTIVNFDPKSGILNGSL